MKLLPLLIALTGAFIHPGIAAEPARAPQIILLKLDDVVARRTGSSPVSPRWQRVTDYLETNQIKGSFGIICESLEKDEPPYFQWIKAIQQAGLIEFWMHGYHLKKAGEPGEFEHGAFEEQKAILEKAVEFLKSKNVVFMTPSEYLGKTLAK